MRPKNNSRRDSLPPGSIPCLCQWVVRLAIEFEPCARRLAGLASSLAQ